MTDRSEAERLCIRAHGQHHLADGGKIFRIECAVGQQINEGDVVVVLESI